MYEIRPYGERGWMIECGNDRTSLLRNLNNHPELLEFVPGAETILLLFKDKKTREEVIEWLSEMPKDKQKASGKLWEIPVRYHGADIENFSKTCGLSPEEIITRHTQPIYEVSFMGFAPGFPYLSGLDARLYSPRKEVPVPRIEPGAVAIGGMHTGIYPVASPGGWHVLGQTEVVLFDSENENFLLSPGDRVQFLSQ